MPKKKKTTIYFFTKSKEQYSLEFEHEGKDAIADFFANTSKFMGDNWQFFAKDKKGAVKMSEVEAVSLKPFYDLKTKKQKIA